jgi:hypothetical protein
MRLAAQAEAGGSSAEQPAAFATVGALPTKGVSNVEIKAVPASPDAA